MLTDHSFEIITHSPAQTYRVGEALGRLLRSGDVVCLHGNLGSGKTCLTQGIGRGLCVRGTISSPTFVFIVEHHPCQNGPYLYHVDLYRIDDPAEVMSLGLEDYMYANGVTVIEWAERALDFLPAERLWVSLSYIDDTRRSLQFQGVGPRYAALAAELAAELDRDDMGQRAAPNA
ncbi:MAG: tRNA (adenosine(37)-N6)-threonylcarbamoyltransferase complex ATPase subunit type 1 TsaE [Anaerolineae bacterium]